MGRLPPSRYEPRWSCGVGGVSGSNLQFPPNIDHLTRARVFQGNRRLTPLTPLTPQKQPTRGATAVVQGHSTDPAHEPPTTGCSTVWPTGCLADPELLPRCRSPSIRSAGGVKSGLKALQPRSIVLRRASWGAAQGPRAFPAGSFSGAPRSSLVRACVPPEERRAAPTPRSSGGPLGAPRVGIETYRL